MSKKNLVKPVNIFIPNARLSYPAFAVPTLAKGAAADATPKYRCTFLLDPRDKVHMPCIKTFKADIERAIIEQWTTRPVKMKPDDEVSGDGNTRVNEETGEIVEGYANMFYIRAANASIPRYLDKQKNVLTAKQAGELFYAGCRVNGIITAWAQDNTFGKAIRYNLSGVMFQGDDESFSSGVAALSAFDAFGDGEAHYDSRDFG